MSAGHVIVWTHDSDHVTAKVECAEPPEAKCRWEVVDHDVCQCEMWFEDGVDDAGPFHLAGDFSESSKPKHRMRFGGECSVQQWMNEDPSTIAESADWAEDIEIGRTAIDVTWNHDYYTWEPVS